MRHARSVNAKIPIHIPRIRVRCAVYSLGHSIVLAPYVKGEGSGRMSQSGLSGRGSNNYLGIFHEEYALPALAFLYEQTNPGSCGNQVLAACVSPTIHPRLSDELSSGHDRNRDPRL